MEYHNYHSTIVEKYNEFEYIQGHIKHIGIDSGKEKNPIWVIYDEDSKKELLLMYCEPDNVCILCKESYQMIIDFENENNSGKKITWYINKNGYVYGRVIGDENDENIEYLSIHQVIMNHYGNGKGTKISSVDHIDRNPLNNTMSNLRIATQEEQMLNSKGILPGTKRERQCIARELPEGITQEMMPKYITYNVNVWDKEQNKTREFFRIEGHSLIRPKVWEGSKSSKVSILDKLEKAKEVLIEMDKGNLPITKKQNIYDEKTEKEEEITTTNECLSLPKNVSVYPERGRIILAFAKQIDGKRKSVKKTLSKLYDLSNLYNKELIEEVNIKLPILNCEVAKKYGKENVFIKIENEIVNQYIEDTKSKFPEFVRIQDFNKVQFLVFNKDSGEERISITKKLPNNYNLNYELHIFNTIIIEKYGNENKLDLRDFPQTENEDIEMPEDMYGNLNCKEPYLFKINNTTTSIMKLPIFYNMQDELNSFNERCNVIEMNNAITQKELCKNILPKNVCISFKKDVYQLLYQQRTKDIRHSKAITLPELFDINIQLVKLNDEICKKFGEDFSILKCKN